MNDRVVFHIGMEKAGSNSIQEGLALLEPRLAAYGVKMASAGRHRPTVARNLLPWRDPDADEWADLRRELRRPESGVNTLVVSNQALWRQRDGILRRLHRYLDGRPAKVVIYVREHADFLQSLALQNSKLPRRAFDFDDPEEFAAFATRRAPNYHEVGERFATIMGAEVEARPFDQAQFAGGELIADFLSVLVPGIELADPPNPSANPSLTPDVARVLHSADVAALRLDDEDVLDAALRLSAEPTRDRYFLSEAMVRDLRRTFADDNQQLAANYLREGAVLPQRSTWTEGSVSPDSDAPNTATLNAASATTIAVRIAEEVAWAPRLIRGWRGRSGPIDGIFGEGWEFTTIDGRTCARMVADTSTFRFRTDYQRECSVNGSLELSLSLESTDPSPVTVTVNGEHVATLDLTIEPIPLPNAATAGGRWEVNLHAPPGPRSIEIHGLHVGYGRPVFARV